MKKLYTTSVLLLSAQLLLSQSSQVFTSNGNFTVPAAITSITIEVVGAGGNGAGNGGGGGGGGGYAKGVYAVTPGAVLAVNIGNGGGGSGGGTSSVASLISATGGGNGTTVGNPNVGGGGAGGTGVNGNIVNRTGGTGGGGYWTYFGGGGGGAAGSTGNGSNGGNTIVYTSGNCLTPGGSAGTGGGAPGGNGGKGAGFVDNQCNSANPAAPGLTYGGGGGGGNGNSSPAQPGAGGYCKIEYGCLAPNAPVDAGSTTTLCSGSSATLNASGSGTINWYANATGGPTIATGSSFVSSALTTTITYYAASETCTVSTQRTAFTVSVLALPVVTISASPGPYCVLQPFTLTASGAQNYMWNSGFSGSTQTITPQGTVVFPPSVAGTDGNGCTNSATLNITVNPQPTLTILPTTTLCAGQVITFTVSGADTYAWSNGAQASSFSVAVTSATVFTVTGTSAAGCSNTAAITQTVIQNPTVNISGKTQLCSGESMTLAASGADTYNWTGQGTNTVITVSPASSTVYTLTGLNSQGCSATITKQVAVSPCVSIKEFTGPSNFVIYPNPSTGVFTLKADRDITLYVYSFSGQVLKVVELDTKNERTSRLDGFAKGIYFIADDKGRYAQKVVVN